MSGNKKIKILGIILVLLLCIFITSRQAEDRNPMIPLRVVTYNIGDLNGQRPTAEDLVKVIKNKGVPDLILLQEVEDERQAATLSRALGLSHYVYAKSKEKESDLAIISRNALFRSDALSFKASNERHPVLVAELEVGGRKVLVCSVHFDRIEAVKINQDRVEVSLVTALRLLKEEVFDDTVRSRSAEELMMYITSRQYKNVIVGGDFNTVPYSKTIRIMEKGLNDALGSTSDYLTGSYRKSSLPVEPRVDFLFHSQNMESREASIIRETAGDHYPVRAVLELK